MAKFHANKIKSVDEQIPFVERIKTSASTDYNELFIECVKDIGKKEENVIQMFWNCY